jgi:DNA-binding cell septation regulator SpoVG
MCKITEVSIYPIRPTLKGLIGFGSVIFDSKLALNSIAIYTRPDGSGIRCVFPVKTLFNGREINVYNPVNSEVTRAITQAIESKIQEVMRTVEEESEREIYLD